MPPPRRPCLGLPAAAVMMLVVGLLAAGSMAAPQAAQMEKNQPSLAEGRRVVASVATAPLRRLHETLRDVQQGVTTRLGAELAYTLDNFLLGAASVVSLGQGVEDLVRRVRNATGDNLDPLLAHPIQKMCFSIGSIVVEVALLLLLGRPLHARLQLSLRHGSAASEPREGMEVSGPPGPASVRRPRCLHTWILLLVSLVPNGVMDVAYIVSMYLRMPVTSILPALIIGKLLRPYFVAAVVLLVRGATIPLAAAPLLALWSGMTTTLSHSSAPPSAESSGSDFLSPQQVVELLLWASTAFGLLFLVAASRS